MLHYFVKDFFAPVIASSYQEGGKFKLYVVSDLLKVIIMSWAAYLYLLSIYMSHTHTFFVTHPVGANMDGETFVAFGLFSLMF